MSQPPVPPAPGGAYPPAPTLPYPPGATQPYPPAPTLPYPPAPYPPAPVPPVLTRAQLGGAAARAGVGYGVLLAGSVLLTLLLFVVGAMSSNPSAGSVSAGAEDVSGGGSVLTLPFVAAGAALFGPFRLAADGSGASATVTVGLTPLALTLALLATLWGWTVLRPLPLRSVRDAWLTALVSGVVLAVGAGVLTAIFRVSVRDSSGSGSLSADALLAALGAFVVGTLGSVLGAATTREARRVRVDLRRLGIPLPAALARAVAASALGFGVALVLVVAGVFVWLAFFGEDFGTAAVVVGAFGVNVGLLGLGLGGLGGVTGSGEASFLGGGSQTVTLFSPDTPGAAWLLLLAVLVGAFLTALVLVRGGVRPRRWQDAWATPTVLAVATLLATLLAGARVSASVSYLVSGSGSVRLGLSPWTFLVAALWGAVAEVLARTVVAAIVPGRIAPAATAPGPVPAPWPVAAPGPVPPPGPVPVPVPVGAPLMSRRAAVATLAVVAGLVVLLTGGFVAKSIVAARLYGPEKQVEAYLDALSDGCATRAIEAGNLTVPAESKALFSDEVYSTVEGRPSDVRITQVETSGSTSLVTAAYTLDGKPTTAMFTLHKDGHQAVLFDKWVLESHLPTLFVSVRDDVDSLVVEGQTIPVSGSSTELTALPGRWSVTLPDRGPYFEAGTTSAVAGGDNRYDVDPLEYTLTDEALAEAEQQAEDSLDACIATNEAEPAGCELRDWYLWEDDAVDLRWTLDTAPTVAATSEGYDAIIEVRLSGGKATFSYTLPKNEDEYRDEAEHESHAYDLDYSVYYQVKDGKIVPYEY